MGRFASLLFIAFYLMLPSPKAWAGLFTSPACGIFIANPQLETELRKTLAEHGERHGRQYEETQIQLWLTREKAVYWLMAVSEQRKNNFVMLSSLRNAMGKVRQMLSSRTPLPAAQPAESRRAEFEQQLNVLLRLFTVVGTYPSEEGMTLLLQIASLDAQMAEGRMLGFRALRNEMADYPTVALEQTPERIRQMAAQNAQARLQQAIEADTRSAYPVRFELSAVTINSRNLSYHSPEERTNIVRNLRGAVAELKSSSPPFLIEEAELEIEFLESYGFANVPVLSEYLVKLGHLRSALIALSMDSP